MSAQRDAGSENHLAPLQLGALRSAQAEKFAEHVFLVLT
jgi:hypothetical protein